MVADVQEGASNYGANRHPAWSSLEQLIGGPAAAAYARAQKVRRRFSLAFLAYIGLILLAATQTTYYYEVIIPLLLIMVFAFFIPRYRAQRECGRLAAAYLSYQLGFPVRVRLGSTNMRGWRSLINLQIKRHDESARGMRRRFIDVGLDNTDPTSRYQHLGMPAP